MIQPSWVPVASGLNFAITQSTVVCDIDGKVMVSRENSETDATMFTIGSVIIGTRHGSVPNVTRFLQILGSILDTSMKSRLRISPYDSQSMTTKVWHCVL